MRNGIISSGNFTFFPSDIKDRVVIDPRVYGDHRGYFMETYHKKSFFDGGIRVDFVQDNMSSSTKGVLRGLHFQWNKPQGKLVRVLKGEVFDVAVDLRRNSSTYGKWEGTYLSEDNRKMVYVPEGCAHGFLVISDSAEFVYKCTDFYDPDDEGGILYNDPDIGIQWPVDKVNKNLISEKDSKLMSFAAYNKV